MTLSHWLEIFTERAAIMEFCGGFPRPEAERLALADVTESHGPKPKEAQRDR